MKYQEHIKQQLTGSDEYKYYVIAYFMHVCVVCVCMCVWVGGLECVLLLYQFLCICSPRQLTLVFLTVRL